ncbi:teneurin-4-like isoform X4 [Symsagittifera roscoffensis]|uniref:teneurin-4-like isoform X4 n=1 Tax=Symsagittifera roscoffensis TaxID=84072 RepID=UPI00307B906F
MPHNNHMPYSYQALCSPLASRMAAMSAAGGHHAPHPSVVDENQPPPPHPHFQSDFDSLWKYPFAFHPAMFQQHSTGHRSFAGVELTHFPPHHHSPMTPLKYITAHRNFNPHHQHTQSYLIDSILNQATSRVNPSGGTGPEMDSATAAATLGRRPLGGNNAHRSSLANQSRISAASHHNQTNPMLLNGGGLRQQSANMEDHPVAPEELMLQFATQNGIGTMYIPGTPGNASTPGDDRVQYVKGNSPNGQDEFEMQGGMVPGTGAGGSIIWPATVSRGASRYGHNGAAPGYQLHRPNSMHDYQPLAPFQDGNGAVHMQAMGTMGAPMAMGGSSGGPKGGMYEGQEEGLQGEGWCVNWKCIITLMCIFTLLLLSLLSLIAIKFYFANTDNLGNGGNNDNSVIELDDYIGKSLEISVAPKSSRMLSIYAMGPSLLTLHIKTSSSRLIIYGLEGAEPHTTNFSFVHALSSSTPQFNSNSKVVYTSAFSSEDMKTVYQYLSNGKWYIRIINDVSSYEVLDILTKIVDQRSKCPKDCNNPQGECNAMGYCVCSEQYRGRLCEKPALNCGSHGRMVRVGTLRNGFTQACKCDPGWTGSLCDQSETGCYPPDCSGNGQCVFGTCQCNPGFSGDTCNRTFCDNRCSDRGLCIDGMCMCAVGYSGENCEVESPDIVQCAKTCNHGSCMYGKCECDKGFRGSTCSQAVCEDNCNGNGQCVSDLNSQWYCSCNPDFSGPNCELKTEPSCVDICKSNQACCKADGSCLTGENRPKACKVGQSFVNSAAGDSQFSHRTSFLEKVSFLYSEQTNAKQIPFAFKSRDYVFVVRGQVLIGPNQPYLGATLSVQGEEEEFGFASTQFDGWFDLMVATNSSHIALQVTYTGTQSGLEETKIVKLQSKNEEMITLLNSIIVGAGLKENSRMRRDLSGCSVDKLPKHMKSMSHFTQFTAVQNKFNEGAVLSQNLVTQSFSPGENFPTMVFNSNSQGARTITLYLGDFSMSNVTSVHVTVSVAGVVFQETLDNNKNDLFMELFWNKTDVYGNKVYGLTEVQAMIEVSLLGCSEKFWVTSIRSEVEGLSCHDSISYQHHYCLTKGDSLYTGRGHAFHLSKYPPVMRHMQCLNPPKVIESLPNGDLLIGDNTQIFHVRGGKIGNRCELNYAVYSFGSSGISDDVEYFIAVDSSSEFFYLSRTDSPVITKVFIKSRTEQVVLGKQGEYCTDGIHNCKDTLKSPKGMTILQNSTLVFVDGLSLRSWTPESSEDIHTLWTPSSSDFSRNHETCAEIPSSQVFLSQLKDVFFSPLDETYILFDYSRAVVKLNLRTSRVSYLASRSNLNCKHMNQQSVARVYYPCSVTVNSKGSLFVADSDPLNKRTVVFEVSQNNLWSEFWHSDQMQIMSAMTVSTNNTLLMINDGEKRVDILGQYKIIPEKPNQFQLTDFENSRIVHFDEKFLHVRSESLATTEFTDEYFSYNSDTTSLRSFVIRAAGSPLAMGSKANEFWSVQKGLESRDCSIWQQSVWNRVKFDSHSMLSEVDSVKIDRSLAMLNGQLVQWYTTKMTDGQGNRQLQSSCMIKQFQTGYSTMCSDGSNYGQFSSFESHPDGHESLTLHDGSSFSLTSALPGLSSDFFFATSGNKFSIDYASKSRNSVYGMQLSLHKPGYAMSSTPYNDVILEKLFRSDRSMVTFGKMKEPSLQFNIAKQTMLPSEVVFQNGRDVRSHKLTFNSARQLTSIKTSDQSNLFDAKYDSGLSVINALQYRVNPNKNSLEVSPMGEADGGHKSLNLYTIEYDSTGKFELSSRIDNSAQKHSVFSLCDSSGTPTTSIFNIFSSKYAYKTLYNTSTMSIETVDGMKNSAKIGFDSANRVRTVSYTDTEVVVSYPPFSKNPNKFAKTVKSFPTMSFASNSYTSNWTINRVTGSKWLRSTFDKKSQILSISLRQQWGASVELVSTYTPLKLKSSFLSADSALLSLTLTDGKGLDVVQVSNKSEFGFNEKFGPNKYHQTTFNYNDRELLQTTVRENEKDGTYSFSVRANNDDQEKETLSYPVSVNSVEGCGKVIHDPIIDQYLKVENCRSTMIISGKTSFQVQKTFALDGRLESIKSGTGKLSDHVNLKFNNNGFISELGDRKFSYNPIGQLIKAEKTDFSVEYVYDVIGRMVSRHMTSSSSGSVDHAFFYLDVKNPEKISHILVADKDDSPKVYEMYYDNRGNLVLVKEKENSYIVSSNPMGTVIELKRIDRGASKASSEEFPPGLHLSLSGSWMDEQMNLVYLNKRFFDLLIHSYLDLDTSFLESAIVSPYSTQFTQYINDPPSFWPKHHLSEIGAFATYMPEVWYNETLQNLLIELQKIKTADGTIQMIPSLSSFSDMFDRLFSTPLDANIPSIQSLPFLQVPQMPSNHLLPNQFLLPPFNRVLDQTLTTTL